MKISSRIFLVAAATSLALIGAPRASGQPGAERTSAEQSDQVSQRGETVPYLGVMVEWIHPAFGTQMPELLKDGQGVMLAYVQPESPAAKAGLKPHDVLLTYDDQKLFTPGQLVRLIHADKTGREVKLGIVRAGKTEEVTVKLGEHQSQMPNLMSRMRSMMPRHTSARPTFEPAEGVWDSFDSLTLKKLDNNRFQVTIEYLTQEDKVARHSFEGTREEIHRAIMNEKDLPTVERNHLLRALNMPEEGLELPAAVNLRGPFPFDEFGEQDFGF